MGLNDMTSRESGQLYERGLDSDRTRHEDDRDNECTCDECGAIETFDASDDDDRKGLFAGGGWYCDECAHKAGADHLK